MDKEAILTVREVAEFLWTGQKTAYTMVQQGALPAFRVRGPWRLRRADIEAWTASQLTAAAEEPRNAESRAAEGPATGSAGQDDERGELRDHERGPMASTARPGRRGPSAPSRRR